MSKRTKDVKIVFNFNNCFNGKQSGNGKWIILLLIATMVAISFVMLVKVFIFDFQCGVDLVRSIVSIVGGLIRQH